MMFISSLKVKKSVGFVRGAYIGKVDHGSHWLCYSKEGGIDRWLRFVVEMVVTGHIMNGVIRGVIGDEKCDIQRRLREKLVSFDDVFDGVFGGVGDEEVVVGKGAVRLSSSCRFEEDENEKKSGKDGIFN
ncbi:hypothetical protein Tco_1295156 [Tanacetum coccineum]